MSGGRVPGRSSTGPGSSIGGLPSPIGPEPPLGTGNSIQSWISTTGHSVRRRAISAESVPRVTVRRATTRKLASGPGTACQGSGVVSVPRRPQTNGMGSSQSGLFG